MLPAGARYRQTFSVLQTACSHKPPRAEPLMVVEEFPPWEQGGASYVLGPQARLIFSYICYMNLLSAFFQRVQNHNLFYL